jgi:hypothetical protein
MDLNKPIYEIVKVCPGKVFIIGLSYPWISQGLESVYEELKEKFPNKRIIFTDGLNQHKTYWYEIVERGNGKSPETRGHIAFAEYNQKVPHIKGWGKILKKIDS